MSNELELPNFISDVIKTIEKESSFRKDSYTIFTDFKSGGVSAMSYSVRFQRREGIGLILKGIVKKVFESNYNELEKRFLLSSLMEIEIDHEENYYIINWPRLMFADFSSFK